MVVFVNSDDVNVMSSEDLDEFRDTFLRSMNVPISLYEHRAVARERHQTVEASTTEARRALPTQPFTMSRIPDASNLRKKAVSKALSELCGTSDMNRPIHTRLMQ